MKAHPAIAAAAAALVLGIVFAVGSGGGSRDAQDEILIAADDTAGGETGGTETETDAPEEGTDAQKEETDSGKETNESEESAWYADIDLSAAEYLLLDGTAYISDGQAVSLIAALADEEVEAVVLQNHSVELDTGTIYVNKPLTVESGLESHASIIVGGRRPHQSGRRQPQ